ncbi:MAG: hypothetical protein M3393_03310 [Actinomycetota bacterium]|nr:hypothetical protein [Actinomycetota bacterium]
MNVKSVRVDDADTRFGHVGKDLEVKTQVEAGSTYDVVIRYAGSPRTVDVPMSRVDSTGLGWHTTKAGQVWTMQKPYGAYTWYPVNDAPSDKARYTVALDVPDMWVVVSTARWCSATPRTAAPPRGSPTPTRSPHTS